MEIIITVHNFVSSHIFRRDKIDVEYKSNETDIEPITISAGSSIDFIQELSLEGAIVHSTELQITVEFKEFFFDDRAHIIVSSIDQRLYEEVALQEGESILLKIEPEYNVKLIQQANGYTSRS